MRPRLCHQASSCRSFSTDLVLALHQPAFVGTRPDVAKADVVWHLAKQRDACSDQYWHACNHRSVDEPSRKELLNRVASVYISVFEPACFELPYDFGWLSRHLLDNSIFDGREIKRTSAQHDHWLLAIKLQVSEFQDDFERPAANDDNVDASEELFEAVRLLLTCL